MKLTFGGKDEAGMPDADDYAKRAAHCRELARTATDPVAQELLLKMAQDMDEEALETCRASFSAPQCPPPYA